MRYKVYGDYGFTSQRLLYMSDQRGRAISFAEQMAECGNFNGFDMIEVAYFAPDGEYVVERKYLAADYDQGRAHYWGQEDEDFLIDEY